MLGGSTKNDGMKHFQGRECVSSCTAASVLIVPVNASNFARLISLSLANAPFHGLEHKKEIILQYESATYRPRRSAPTGNPSQRAAFHRYEFAKRLIKFSGNQICHSAVQF